MLSCPHCSGSGLYSEFGIIRCWICGYWADPHNPPRMYAEQKWLDLMTKQELIKLIQGMRPEYEKSMRWFDKVSQDSDEQAQKKREAQRKWRDTHRDEINEHRRERNKRIKSMNAIDRVQRG